jgi:uncharacterized phage protein (TIGR02218 family)
MKTISPQLKAHLQGEVLTVCTLWKITRADGAVFGFTDCTHDLTYLSVTYYAASGHTPSSIKTTSNLSVDNLEISSVLDSEAITEADIQAGLWDYAEVVIMLVNYNALCMGHMIQRKGWMGNVKTGRHAFTAELRGMLQPLQQNIGRLCNEDCDAMFGDARCGLDALAYTVTGSVTSDELGLTGFADSSLNVAYQYFKGGLLTWLTGENAGYRMEVQDSFSSEVYLQQGMPNAINIGDTYMAIAGCDKSANTCSGIFNNIANFRGFPNIPGFDKMVAGK